MVATSLTENPCDRLYKLRDQLNREREYAWVSPVGHTNRICEVRFDLLTIARDFGRLVQVLLADAMRCVTDDRFKYIVIRNEIRMIADKIGQAITLFDSHIGIHYPSDEGLRLTMQLRLHAHLLSWNMTIPYVRLYEIDREDYHREYSGDIARDSHLDHLADLAGTSSENEDCLSNLDVEQTKSSLSREVPTFESTLHRLSNLIESLSVPPVSANGEDEITSEVPQTGTDWTPCMEPDSDDAPTLESHQCAATAVEPNPRLSASSTFQDEPGLVIVQTGTGQDLDSQSESGDVSSHATYVYDHDALETNGRSGTNQVYVQPNNIAESKSQTRKKTLEFKFEEDPQAFLDCLSETKITVLFSLLSGPGTRKDIHKRLSEYNCTPELDSLTRILRELANDLLIEACGCKHRKIAANVSEYLRKGENLSEKVLRVRNSRNVSLEVAQNGGQVT